MRACTFSATISGGSPPNAGSSVASKVRINGSIGSVVVSMPRFAATSRASSMLPWLEYGDGISTPSTRSGPSAAAAIAAVSAESMPPDSPSSTRVKPHLRA